MQTQAARLFVLPEPGDKGLDQSRRLLEALNRGFLTAVQQVQACPVE